MVCNNTELSSLSEATGGGFACTACHIRYMTRPITAIADQVGSHVYSQVIYLRGEGKPELIINDLSFRAYEFFISRRVLQMQVKST